MMDQQKQQPKRSQKQYKHMQQQQQEQQQQNQKQKQEKQQQQKQQQQEQKQQEEFQQIMLEKLLVKAKKGTTLQPWLKVIAHLRQGSKHVQRREILRQLSCHNVFQQQFWISEVELTFGTQWEQEHISVGFMGLADGYYQRLAILISDKLMELFRKGHLRATFVIYNLQKLIQQFRAHGELATQIYTNLRQIYKSQKQPIKISSLYIREITKGYNNFDVVYDEYLCWQEEQANQYTSKQQLLKLYAIAQQNWQAQQSAEILKQQCAETVSDVKVINDLLELQNRNCRKLDSQAYLGLVEKLPTEREKLWFLRRACFNRQALVEEYMIKVEMEVEVADDEMLLMYRTILTFPVDYTNFYLNFLVRRLNPHLISTDALPQNYNNCWTGKVLHFRAEMQRLISTCVFQKMNLYNYWLQVEAGVIRDSPYLIQLFEKAVKAQPSLELFGQQAREMIAYGMVKEAKVLLKRACDKYKYSGQSVKQYKDFLGVFGSVVDVVELKNVIQGGTGFWGAKKRTDEGKVKDGGKAKDDVGKQVDKNIVHNQSQPNNQKRSPETKTQQLQAQIESLQKKRIHMDSGNTIFLKGFPSFYTQQQIMSLLNYSDKINQIRMITKNGIKRNYCYIQYRQQQYALKEVRENKTNYTISVSKPPNQQTENKTLFLAALPSSVTRQKLEEILIKYSFTDMRLIIDRERCYAYVDFASQEVMRTALEGLKEERISIDGKKVIVQGCDSDRIKSKKFNRVVFIKNLAFKAKEGDIRAFFDGMTVSKVEIPLNDEGRKKGFAYLQFENFKDYQQALDKRKGMLFGRQFQIYRSDRDITSHSQGKNQYRRHSENRKDVKPQLNKNNHKKRDQKKKPNDSHTKATAPEKSGSKSNAFFSNFFK